MSRRNFLKPAAETLKRSRNRFPILKGRPSIDNERSQRTIVTVLYVHMFRTSRAVAKRRDAYWNKTSECHLTTTEGLVRQQRNLCAKNLDLMPTVVYSARQMAQVCQETFYDSRWNCSSVLLAPNFNPDLNGGKCSFSRLYIPDRISNSLPCDSLHYHRIIDNMFT